MRRLLASVTFFALCSGWSLSVQALELEAYPNSRLLDETQASVQNQHLVGSAIRKVTGRLRARQELWLDGVRTRQLLQLPEGHTVDDAMRHYQGQLEQLRAEFLYQCGGRDCGPSNLWANDVFKVARLYGPDKDQRYSLALLRSDQPTYLVLYSIRRGNGRVLVLVDRLTTKANGQYMIPDLTSVVRLLDRRGFYDLEGGWTESTELGEEPSYQLLRSLLTQEPGVDLALVGQVGAQRLSQANWGDSLQRSQEQAQRVRDALIEDGIAPERLQVLGLGSALSQERGEAKPGLRLLRLF